MLAEFLKQDFRNNVDIVNTINKILLDLFPEDYATNEFLLYHDNSQHVYEILSYIKDMEKKDPQKLSKRKRKRYIVELNKLIDQQLSDYVNGMHS